MTGMPTIDIELVRAVAQGHTQGVPECIVQAVMESPFLSYIQGIGALPPREGAHLFDREKETEDEWHYVEL